MAKEKKSDFTGEFIKNTPKPTHSYLFELIYNIDGTIVNANSSTKYIREVFIPNKLDEISIFDYLIPTKGLTKAQFKELLITKTKNPIDFTLLVPPNINNINPANYYDTDLLTQSNGIYGAAQLSYLGNNCFLIQIIIKHQFILTLPGIMTSDILIMLNNSQEILWYSYGLIGITPYKNNSKKKTHLKEILTKETWNNFKSSREKINNFYLFLKSIKTPWDIIKKDPLDTIDSFSYEPTIPWKQRDNGVGTQISGRSFAGYKPNLNLKNKDIQIKVDIQIPNSLINSSLSFGIVLGYESENFCLIGQTPDNNGYLFNFDVSLKNLQADFKVTLKKQGTRLFYRTFFMVKDKIDHFRKIIESKDFTLTFNKTGPLFSAYLNKIKIFEHFDESETNNLNEDQIGFLTNNPITFSNLEIKTREISLAANKLPSPFIDLVFNAKKNKVFESYMNMMNFQGSPTPTLYLRDVTHNRLLTKKLNQRMGELNSDLSMAKTFQLAMAKIKLKDIPPFNYTSAYLPAGEVGGDMIDLIALGDNKYAIIIFDVSGHGIASSLVCGIAKNIIKSSFLSLNNLEKITNSINLDLIEASLHEMFLTAFFGIVDLNKSTLDFVRAGHPHQYLIQQNKNKIIPLDNRNMLLGVLPNYSSRSTTINIAKGNKLFCFTDGLTEAMNQKSELYTKDRLFKILNDNQDIAIEDLKDKVLKDIESFTCLPIDKQADDIAILILEF